MHCYIFVPKSKVNEKNVEWDKLNDIKLPMGQRMPKYAQRKNIKKEVGQKLWDKVRKDLIEESNSTCCICGYHADNPSNLHAHEVWEYDENNYVFILKEIKLICERCHGCTHPENSVLHSIKSDEKKGIVREVPKIHLLYMHMMRVNKWNLDTLRHYQLTFAKEKSELIFKEMHNPRTTIDPQTIKRQELENAKWRFHIEENTPCYEEILKVLKEKEIWYG